VPCKPTLSGCIGGLSGDFFAEMGISQSKWNIPVIQIDIFAIYKSLRWDYLLDRKISADSKQR
jgi:hypothetical protein